MTGQQIEIVSPSAQTLEFSVPKDITFDDWRAIGVQLEPRQRPNRKGMRMIRFIGATLAYAGSRIAALGEGE